MAIIKQYHKDTNITYVYESHSYRDKDTKQPKSRRKLIGRISCDRQNRTSQKGNICPAGKHRRTWGR